MRSKIWATIVDLLCVGKSPSLDTQSETGEVCDQEEVSGKRRRGRPHTSYHSNITKWMSGSVERITRDTRDRSGWRILIRCAAWRG